jgi:4-diphosphocytidyl-2-C-methyl-D-erythritol kinase
MRPEGGRWQEIAPAKLNLALHVRGKLPDGRHALETLFAFCTDGDRLSGGVADELTLTISGPFAAALDDGDDNLVLRAARALQQRAGVGQGAALHLDKRLPVASGIGGGSADAAAALRLLTAMWRIDPAHAAAAAPALGSDVAACLLSMTARGEGAGDRLELIDDPRIPGTPVLLVNPRVPLFTAAVFRAWDGEDRGGLEDWQQGRNDLEAPARTLVPVVSDVLDWLTRQKGARLARMSGTGATCFAFFDDDEARDAAAANCPNQWWHLASTLR